MNKKITTLITALSVSATLSAQSYSKLWKTVDEYTTNDLPKSALQCVAQIQQKAIDEKNDVQLLRALLMQRMLGAEISADTAQVYLEQIVRALETENQPAKKALWHSALAQCYESVYNNYDYRTDDVRRSETLKQIESHYTASLENLGVLADEKVKKYVPLITYNKGSRYYADDLLHVLATVYLESRHTTQKQRKEWHERLAKFYTSRQLPNAALMEKLAALDIEFENVEAEGKIADNPHYQALCNLAKECENEELAVNIYNEIAKLTQSYLSDYDYDKLEAENAGLIYEQMQKALARYGKGKDGNELRNLVQQITNSKVSIKNIESRYYPADTLQLQCFFRNQKKAQLRLVMLTPSYEEYEQMRRKNELDKLRNLNLKKATTVDVECKAAAEPYAWTEQEVRLNAPAEPGVYRLELWKDGKKASATDFCVTQLTALTFSAQANKQHRVTVVDQRSGQPVPHATVSIYRNGGWSNGGYTLKTLKTLTANEEGMVWIEGECDEVGVSTAADKASRFFSLYKISKQRQSDERSSHLQLYTDRSIYRPGQKVQFSGVAYRKDKDLYEVRRELQTKVELRDANYQLIDTLLVKTDEMGSFCGSFTLPKKCLPGYFTLKAKKGGSALSFKVEEYKRPTFTATTQPVTTAYALGDTVQVKGEAKTYSGVAVGGARVQYTVERRTWFFWNDNDQVAPQTGETVTDTEGHFTLPVSLTKADAYEKADHYNRYSYTVSYTVTAENGETAQGSTVLSVATRPAYLTANVPSVIYRQKGKELPCFTFNQINASGEEMKATGHYRLFCNEQLQAEGDFETGKAFRPAPLADLPSGLYTLRYRTNEAEEESALFTLLSEADKQPVNAKADFFCHQEVNELGDSAVVVVGSPCRDAILFYDLLANGKVVESKRIALNNELLHLKLNYSPLYGDGATLYLALQRNGTLHEEQVSIVKPRPNKKLQLQWSTFRSRLTPGQQEEWRLRVTTPSGQPAQAQVMACLYDASLDALYPSTWQPFQIHFNRTLPTAWWRSINYFRSTSLSSENEVKLLSTQTLLFSRWRSELFHYYDPRYHYYHGLGGRMRSMSNRVMMMADASAPAGMAPIEANYMVDNNQMMTDEAAPSAAKAGRASGATTQVTPRSNFAETAFFCPALRTDTKGEVSLVFTLPESLTQWQFRALAHDAEMNNGQLEATAVARKELMVEPALPRFLRQGDTTDLPVKVTNLSEKPLEAMLKLTICNAENQEQRLNESKRITLQPGESSVYSFPYTAKGDEGMLLCTATAQAPGFSDGEEHYLPVLTNQVEVTRSLPFSLTQRGTKKLPLDTLFNAKTATHKTLSVEISSNPTWYAVTALPYLAPEAGCINAVEWATRLYTINVARQVAASCPEVQKLALEGGTEVDELARLKTEGLNDATPWLQQGETQKQRTRALGKLFDEEAVAVNLHTAIDKLKALQNAEGGLSWYPGMPANVYTTVDVAILLARIEALTPYNEAHQLLVNAKKFLDERMAKDVEEMKAWEKKHKQQQVPREYQLRYLYLRCLMNERPDDDATFLLDRAASLQRDLTMYGKAVTALVLKQAGRTEEAECTLESLLEHTVSSQEMGRYFDTPRAEWSWQSYRIPTQCAAIEALQQMGQTKLADEMRLWLMQAKRTQMWETSRATADAVFALLSTVSSASSTKSLTVMPLQEQAPVYYTLYNNKKIVGFNAKSESTTPETVGYFKQTYTTDEATTATSLTLQKSSDGLSWGSVYATFMAPASEVMTDGKGLLLTRRFEVKRGTEWVALSANDVLAKGDRVRQIFQITADRDYDFVSLSAARPACLEPAQPLSGYCWNMGLPAYRAVRDARTDYFTEKLNKGTHQFTEELFVDRSGTYTTGISKIECVYAPEFRGTTAEVKLQTK